MLKFYKTNKSKLEAVTGVAYDDAKIVWIDMFSPSRVEEVEVEQFLLVDVPTREEMHDIEVSSRLYSEDGALFVTVTLVTPSQFDELESHSVTFVIKEKMLVTLRYFELRSLNTFLARVQRDQMGPIKSGFDVFLNLMESAIDCLSDELKIISNELDLVSRSVFQRATQFKNRNADLENTLAKIGHCGDLNGKLRESLLSLSQVFIYLATTRSQYKKEYQSKIDTYAKDIESLIEYTNSLSSRVNLILDATLGMINIHQNKIIKIFSVASVIFMPPTLVASMYGMNFKHMPELEWLMGYPFAVLMMVLFAVLPYMYFKKKGWL